jgi:chaperone required for assembly of F1-ATPase
VKRFYKEVVVAGDFSILLDGKPINTPKKAKLAAPTRALAEAIAHEWREQSGDIRPANMSLTKLANTAIDHAQELRSNIEAELLGFGRHDLLCYRAVGPHELILRQRMAWDPLLDWAHHTLGARLTTTHGIGHVEQGTDALAALDREVRSQDSWTLIGLQTATTITGSLILAFAIASGRLASAEAFALSRIDETFQLEKWGRDSDAEQRARCHAAELEMAAKFIELARA